MRVRLRGRWKEGLFRRILILALPFGHREAVNLSRRVCHVFGAMFRALENSSEAGAATCSSPATINNTSMAPVLTESY